jgi:hypothetical protein
VAKRRINTGEILYPTPEYVRKRREELFLTSAELSRMMGYSEGYVGTVEQENMPVTRRFAERFWAVVENGSIKRAVTAIAPLGVPDDVYILRPARECACGCKMSFIPNSGNHRYLDSRHRRRVGGYRGERT